MDKMNARKLNAYVTEFIPETITDNHSIRNMVQAMFKMNNGTIFTSRTASQLMRDQFGVYVDYHIMVDILESLERLDVLDYDGINQDGCQRYKLVIK